MWGKDKQKQQEVTTIPEVKEVEVVEPVKSETEQKTEQAEVTPYDTLYKGQDQKQYSENKSGDDSKQINLSFSVNSFSSVLCIASLCFTFLFAILTSFGVVMGYGEGIFFLVSSLLAVTSMVVTYKNCKNKVNMLLAFAVFTILITAIVYF